MSTVQARQRCRPDTPALLLCRPVSASTIVRVTPSTVGGLRYPLLHLLFNTAALQAQPTPIRFRDVTETCHGRSLLHLRLRRNQGVNTRLHRRNLTLPLPHTVTKCELHHIIHLLPLP